jgi:hypothetical protein
VLAAAGMIIGLFVLVNSSGPGGVDGFNMNAQLADRCCKALGSKQRPCPRNCRTACDVEVLINASHRSLPCPAACARFWTVLSTVVSLWLWRLRVATALGSRPASPMPDLAFGGAAVSALVGAGC